MPARHSGTTIGLTLCDPSALWPAPHRRRPLTGASDRIRIVTISFVFDLRRPEIGFMLPPVSNKRKEVVR
ncbi:hypothetical protein KL86PLE_100123 [uncultured Pleomorphomonas sp.]|uniref:Uncharacterized protein n=1 Tax=uncultured Pleomorphomonas sp. TaxID=442121 RepID=A0A212L1C8_9HYPH|nr:hypothetical protein KL86PLE_100123 [uncultured Pleomorphomonas sp.]